MPPELATVLTQAAKQLGVTVNELWPQLVYITFVSSIFWFVETVLVLLALTGITIFCCLKATKQLDFAAKIENGKDRYGDPIRGMSYGEKIGLIWLIWGVPGVILICIWLLCLANLATDVAGIAAPEAQTAINIVKIISGK